MRIKRILTAVLIGTAAMIFLGCAGFGNVKASAADENSLQENGAEPEAAGRDEARAPYVIKTVLREYTNADPAGGIVAYGRYTELIVEDGAPETLKKETAACNRRAEESVISRVDAMVGAAADETAADPPDEAGPVSDEQAERKDPQYITFAYIVNVMRADDTAFSFLEAELESGLSKRPGVSNPYEYTFHFFGHTFETETGEEILLSDLIEEESLQQTLEDAVSRQCRIKELVRTEGSGYAWTADALGIRFCFNSDAVDEDKRQDAGDYSHAAVTAGIPYTALGSEKAAFLAGVPDEYIARMDTETAYDLPYGDMSVMITEKEDGNTVLRRMPDQGEEEERIIEYADNECVYYIIRSRDGFYLYREKIGYQEGFFYDFSRPDGGFGRFAYNTAQYIDSYLREIRLSTAYNPRCVHMSEKKRSFGKESFDGSSFVPTGHYSFPDDPDARYKLFELTDEGLSIDSYNVACRLLEDFAAVKLDEEGNETGGITVGAGSAMILETVRGEGRNYLTPTERSNYDREYIYDCRLADGTRVRFVSDYESTLFVDGANMNRFTEPVSLWEARFTVEPEPAEVFTVEIGGREYPVIPDYSLDSHNGEQIDFGDDIWWQVEGYVGKYVITGDDMEAMKEDYYTQDVTMRTEGTVTLEITEDGQAVLDYFGLVYEGDLPEKRCYHTNFSISMESPEGSRTFMISLREGDYHSVPEKIEVYSEGLPATNEPSGVPPLLIFLTKTE